MNSIYNILIFIFGILMKIVANFHHKAKLWVTGRQDWENTLRKKRTSNEQWIWFHCSSNGEFEDCFELFNLIKKENPTKKIILTFFSPTGIETHGNSTICDLIMYLPLDTKENASKFLSILKPSIAFFSRSDFWYNYLTQLKSNNTPTYLLAFSLTKQSNFIKWPGKLFFQKSIHCFDFIFCQNNLTLSLLKENFNYTTSTIVGNSRFDRIYQESFNKREFPGIDNFITNDFMLVAGSTLDKDEENILYVMKQLENHSIKCLLVPHEIDNTHLSALISKNPTKIIRYSNIEQLKPSHKILVIDFVGGLKYLYRYADIALIGGGFDSIGIHNIIEPSVYGVNTTFGPNYRDYPEAIDLLEMGTSIIHHSKEELLTQLKEQLSHPKTDAFKAQLKKYVIDNTGASLKTLEIIRDRNRNLV